MTIENIQNPFTKLKFRNLVLQFILLSIIIGFGLEIFQLKKILNQQDLILTIYILQFVLLSLWSVKNLQKHRAKLKHVIGNFPKNYNWLSLGLVPAIIIFSISNFLVLFYVLSLAAPSLVQEILRSVSESPSIAKSTSLSSKLLVSFAVCIVAPIAEEFIFRGIILQRWSTKWGIRSGLISSSLLFGFLHPQNPIGLSIFGIILGLLYIKTHSLIVPIAFHGLNNILAVLPQLFSRNSSTTSLEDFQQIINTSWLAGIILMAISLPFLLRFIRKNWLRKDTIIPYLSNVSKGKAYSS